MLGAAEDSALRRDNARRSLLRVAAVAHVTRPRVVVPSDARSEYAAADSLRWTKEQSVKRTYVSPDGKSTRRDRHGWFGADGRIGAIILGGRHFGACGQVLPVTQVCAHLSPFAQACL